MMLFSLQRARKQRKIILWKTYFQWFLIIVTKNHKKYTLTWQTTKQVVLLVWLLRVNTMTRIFGGRFNGQCYFSVNKSSHRKKTFQCVSSRLDSSLDLDANGHQSSFWFNSCSHGVKIEVKQVDDNYTWLYNENQYLYVEL